MDKYAFNEEAAKAGKPIEFSERHGGAWIDVDFIGMSKHGLAVIELPTSGVQYAANENLRMKRVTKTVYANLYRSGLFRWHLSEDVARKSADSVHLLLAVAAPVEIEE